MKRIFRRGSTALNVPITAASVMVFLVLFGSLLWDRYSSHPEDLADNVRFEAAETDDWFLIRMGGSYSGFGRSRQYRTGSHWTLRDDLHLSFNIQGQIKPLRIVSESQVDEGFRLISFRLKVSSGIISFEQKGRMEGRELVLEIPRQQGGGVRRLKIKQAPRISRSLGLPLPLTGLEVGQEIQIPIFDPMEGQKTDAVIKVLERSDLLINGRTQSAWRVRASYRSADLVMWIDDEGRLLKGRLPLGITVIRSNRGEIAANVRGTKELPELVSLSTVHLEGTLPEDSDLEFLRMKVIGGTEWDIPSDNFRQKFSKSELTISREEIPEATYALPCTDSRMERHLAPSVFIRSDHPQVVETARQIVGAERNPVKAARLINVWVHDNLKKVPTPAVPDAHTVLVRRQGDCNEHAVLAAALARAVGLPAQIAVGLVHSGDGFYYHAWVTYWAGERWFSGDPLMNQIPAGPTHVTLLYGDVEKHVNVLSFLGRLKLEVLEVKSKSSG